MEEKLDRIIELLEKMEYNSRTYKGYALWSEEQDELLIDLFEKGASNKLIISRIKEAFNVDRTEGAINSRARKLGLTRVVVEQTPISEENVSKLKKDIRRLLNL